MNFSVVLFHVELKNMFKAHSYKLFPVSLNAVYITFFFLRNKFKGKLNQNIFMLDLCLLSNHMFNTFNLLQLLKFNGRRKTTFSMIDHGERKVKAAFKFFFFFC